MAGADLSQVLAERRARTTAGWQLETVLAELRETQAERAAVLACVIAALRRDGYMGAAERHALAARLEELADA